ncbi:MAG: DNA recombination protein RmuC [Deltaproteobacteria bacterium]|nr:DNA recombination protein RmuC [Deltaproteobacteria bacterium]
MENASKDEFARNREEANRNSKDAREEMQSSFTSHGEAVEKRLENLTATLGVKLDSFQDRMDKGDKDNRAELAASLKSFENQLKTSVADFNAVQKQKLDELVGKQDGLLQTTERRLETMRNVIETRLKSIQDDNGEKLERMRQTVDEKLHKTLEERLGQSFQVVSASLEQVQRGLGEMQTLASGVGDLKKVLANVKTRGTLGEFQLEMILEQFLSPAQYLKNVATRPGSRENVEFAIKLPSKDAENETILLPMDSKFPQDKYQALLDAYDKADHELIDAAIKELDRTIKSCAKEIRDKYVNPPLTTDFAIMFLPFEGLYAEVVKRPELYAALQREFKVNVAGPSTVAAFINSLQMGFRTLAIQKRSSEVWGILGAVKTEFGKFGEMLDSVHKNIETASRKISEVKGKSSTIAGKLKKVEALPQHEAGDYPADASTVETEGETVNQKESEKL